MIPQWRKSSYSSGEGGLRVEVARYTAAQWRISSHSGGQGGDCVEVGAGGCACGDGVVIAVRDSKDPDGPALGFDRAEWGAFLGRVRLGAYPSS